MVNAETRQVGVSILTISNEDLLNQGFETEKINDEMFAVIVKKLKKHYDETFSETLHEIITTTKNL